MTRTRALAVLLALPALAACSPTDDAATTPSPTLESTSWATMDRAGDLSAFSASIVSASEVEPGRIAVITNLVDGVDSVDIPRQICEAAAGLDGVTYVSVAESDGTAWVLYGHPAYAEGVCSAV